MKLSVIIPFGLSKERTFIKQRLLEKLRVLKSNDEIEFIFVEGFSSDYFDAKSLVLEYKHRYFKDEKQLKFSQGACRNLGSLKARADVLLFMDIDCFISSQNFEKILALISLREIAKKKDEFFLLPCIYLSKEASEFLKDINSDLWDIYTQDAMLKNDETLVLNLALASSLLVMNKQKFLELNGYSDEYIGHGYEDFDFLTRLIISTCKFEKMPKNLVYDARNWNFTSFEGFRALFSLFGYESMYLGLYALHFYHEAINQDSYLDNRDKNHKIFFNKLKEYEKIYAKTKEKNLKFYKLKHLAYKAYLYELKGLNYSFLPSSFKAYISHLKAYRLFRKFIKSPRIFFQDMRKKDVLPK